MNDKNIKNLKIRNILRYFIMILAGVTIILASLALFKVIPYIYCIISFLTYTILRFIREKITIQKK